MKRNCKRFIHLHFLMQTMLIVNCAPEKDSQLKFDSPTHVQMILNVEYAYLIVSPHTWIGRVIPSSNVENGISENARLSAKRHVLSQLDYMIGQLNGIGMGAKTMKNEDLIILDVSQLSSGFIRIDYQFQRMVAAPLSWRNDPPEVSMVFPSTYDDFAVTRASAATDPPLNARLKFVDHYGRACNYRPSEQRIASFFYYFRPQLRGCPFHNSSYNPDEDIAQRVVGHLKLSERNHQTGESSSAPEYDEIWEDNRLIVTSVFGASREIVSHDAGFLAYQQFYKQLLAKRPHRVMFGSQLIANPPPSITPRHNDFVIHYYTHDNREVIVRAIFAVSLRDEWIVRQQSNIGEWARISDLLVYSGHSGYGGSVRDFVNLIDEFSPSRYYVVLMNGCSTYSYLDDSLRHAISDANPGDVPEKYYDVIFNTNLSYFSTNARTTLALIEALAGQSKTYYEILQTIGYENPATGLIHQGPAVDGDQANSTRFVITRQ